MNSSKKKISLITCFMGEQLPPYFAHFLVTAGWNSSIDFIVCTNAIANVDIPSNVKLVSMTLDGFRALAAEKLGVAVAINDTQKLNDFKPAFGLIFSDYLTDCDFWGYVDAHVLLGNLRVFLSEDQLETYDFVSVREEFPTSYFGLYKKNDVMCHFFQRSKDWETVFDNPNYHGFEEFGLDVSTLKSKEVSDKSIESMFHVFLKSEAGVKCKMQTLEHTLQFRELVEVDAAGCKVIGKDEEYILANFLHLCRNRRYQFPALLGNPHRIYVDVFGIKTFHGDEKLTCDERIAEVLDLPISIDYDQVRIADNNEVRISINGSDYHDLFKTSLLDTQILLYVHHHAPTKGSEIVDFFLQSNIFHINKPAPPDRAKIDNLFFGYLGSQMQYGQIVVQ